MPRLLDVPTEILLLVVSHLTAADKASLIRVCKTLHEVAEPTLYHGISMEWIQGHYSDADAFYHEGVLPPHLVLLTRVLTCPRLAKIVKCVEYTGTKSTSQWQSAANIKLNVDDLKRLTDLVISSGLTAPFRTCALNARARVDREEEPWVRHIMEGDVEWYQALFLSRLPNITKLQIGFDPYMGFEYISATLRHALCSNAESPGCSSFRCLSRVDLYADMFYRDLSIIWAQYTGFHTYLDDILPFFYLPSLQEFRVVMPHDDVQISWPTNPPCASALRILCLQRSHVKVEALEKLLVTTPNLEILEYDFCCRLGNPRRRSPQYLTGNGLERALAHVKATLKILRISVHFYDGTRDTYYEDENPNFGIEGVLHSLEDFQTISDVEVPYALILGSNSKSDPLVSARLPLNLTSLIFRDDMALYHAYPWRSGELLKILPTFLSLWSTQNPHLASLGLNLNESRDDWDESAQSAFVTQCQSLHATPKIHKEPWDCSSPGTPVFAADRFK